jgi:putative ABC transport system ATP-binding protein
MSDVTIAATRLSKSYEGASTVTAVDEVSLAIHAGEVVLISGPNGSGKTTLLAMLGGLLQPSSGTVTLNGTNIHALPPRSLAEFRLRHVGFVFQAFRLIEELTARENVELVLEMAGAPDAAHRAAALIEEAGMTGRADRLARNLSSGEKQCVAIARALANDPAVILADEPTGSLDSRAGELAMRLLGAAARNRGKAVVIVSHDARIEKHAGRVLRMVDGTLS